MWVNGGYNLRLGLYLFEITNEEEGERFWFFYFLFFSIVGEIE